MNNKTYLHFLPLHTFLFSFFIVFLSQVIYSQNFQPTDVSDDIQLPVSNFVKKVERRPTFPSVQITYCPGSMMMSAIAPDFLKYLEDIPPDAVDILGGRYENTPLISFRNPFTNWGKYEKNMFKHGGLIPLLGNMNFSGLVNERGSACTDPVGDNFMLEFSFANPAQKEGMQRQINERLDPNKMTVEEMNEMKQNIGKIDPMRSEVMAKSLGFNVPTFPASVTRDLKGSTMFEIYSPNGISWITGAVLKPTADHAVYEHNKVGNWSKNSAASLLLVLPGIHVSLLKQGMQYAVIMPSLGAGIPFYVKTEGDWTHRDIPQNKCVWKNPAEGFQVVSPADPQYKSKFRDVFQGQIMVTEVSSELRGELMISDISNGIISGNFVLEGDILQQIEQYKFRYSDNIQATCEYGDPSKLVGTEKVDTATRKGAIKIEGDFVSYASVEVSRPGRLIAWTRKIDPLKSTASTKRSKTSKPAEKSDSAQTSKPSATKTAVQTTKADLPPVEVAKSTPGNVANQTSQNEQKTDPAQSQVTPQKTEPDQDKPKPDSPATDQKKQYSCSACFYSLKIGGKTVSGKPGDVTSLMTTPEGGIVSVSATNGQILSLEFASGPSAGKQGVEIRSVAGTLGVGTRELYQMTDTGLLTITENSSCLIHAVGRVKIQVIDQRGNIKRTETLELDIAIGKDSKKIPGFGDDSAMCTIAR